MFPGVEPFTLAPRSWPTAGAKAGKDYPHMRMFLGIVLGCILTVGGVYVFDHVGVSSADARPMVNWDVVAKNVDDITALARDGWKKIAG